MKRKAVFIILPLLTVFLFLVILKVYGVAILPDTQCAFPHATKDKLPQKLTLPADYFKAGNYYYDIGNCRKAVEQYSKAIAVNKDVPQFYNNRGYTYMRLREYDKALMDMNIAIMLDPGYAEALLNRGDLYNYYGPVIDRQHAIADYKKVIALGVTHNNSVCGHLAMAQTDNLIPLALLRFIFNRGYCK